MAHRTGRPALERALARNVEPAVYTEDMFKATRDAASREAARAVIRADLNLVGAMRAERWTEVPQRDSSSLPVMAVPRF
jgi:hypothetical protein